MHTYVQKVNVQNHLLNSIFGAKEIKHVHGLQKTNVNKIYKIYFKNLPGSGITQFVEKYFCNLSYNSVTFKVKIKKCLEKDQFR